MSAPLPKLIDLAKGDLMVSADIHGHWKDFIQVMSTFKTLRKEGKAKYLVFIGDLVHAPEGIHDESVKILDTLMEKGCNEPGSKYFAILGNHELAHIYHVDLWKGNQCYTRGFEVQVADDRTRYMRFFEQMPFGIRTAGGTLVIHAGAGKALAGKLEDGPRPDFQDFLHWDHLQHLAEAAQIAEVEDPDLESGWNARIGAAFVNTPAGRFLWEMTMNKNERQYGRKAYSKLVKKTLAYLSSDLDKKLRTLVTGHIGVGQGAEVAALEQVRFSTSKGARRKANKKYLLFSAKERFQDGYELIEHAFPLYPP